MIVVQHLFLDLTVLEKYDSVSVALEVLVVCYHYYCYALFVAAVAEVVYLEDKVHYVYC